MALFGFVIGAEPPLGRAASSVRAFSTSVDAGSRPVVAGTVDTTVADGALASTNAVVAICVESVPGGAVGAVRVPVRRGRQRAFPARSAARPVTCNCA